MEQLYEKIGNSIDYNTYNKIKNILVKSTNRILPISMILNINNLPFGDAVGTLAALLLTSSVICVKSSIVNYTKDVVGIRKLYLEFIKNYTKMNKMFGNNDPVSIYTMYNYLLNGGYLSNNKKFVFENNKYLSLVPVMGAHIVNGSGVCRHISSMLTDILNDSGIDSCNLCCYTLKDSFDMVSVDKRKMSRMKNIRLINKHSFNLEQRETLITVMDELSKLGIFVDVKLIKEEKFDFESYIYGNHLITYSFYNGKSYYMDPTNEIFLKISDINNKLLYDGENGMLIRELYFYNINALYNNDFLYKLKQNIGNSNNIISNQDVRDIKISTLNMCKENIDIFEKFYDDNSDLYREISDRFAKIRKK